MLLSPTFVLPPPPPQTSSLPQRPKHFPRTLPPLPRPPDSCSNPSTFAQYLQDRENLLLPATKMPPGKKALPESLRTTAALAVGANPEIVRLEMGGYANNCAGHVRSHATLVAYAAQTNPAINTETTNRQTYNGKSSTRVRGEVRQKGKFVLPPAGVRLTVVVLRHLLERPHRMECRRLPRGPHTRQPRLF